MSPIFDAVSGVFTSIMTPITSIVNGWQTRSTAKLASDLAVHEATTKAKIDYLATAQKGDIDWDSFAIQHSGWKSGYLTIILSLPLILMFFPGVVPYIKQGFEAINEAPNWYTGAVGVMIASDFGYRKFADIMTSFKK